MTNNLKALLDEMCGELFFLREPVDCVLWVENSLVTANDYNPNSVAPPEMKLLEHSICEDGYTQPIVGWKSEETIIVVDGFHRNRVGKESPQVLERVKGYLPVVATNGEALGLTQPKSAAYDRYITIKRERKNPMNDPMSQ